VVHIQFSNADMARSTPVMMIKLMTLTAYLCSAAGTEHRDVTQRTMRVEVPATKAPATMGHAAADAGDQSKPCALKAPGSCVVSDWGDWSPCQHTCGQSTPTTRIRTVLKAATEGGGCDDELSQKASCSAAECPEDCVWSDWNDWDGCAETCGDAHKTRGRDELLPRFGGLPCRGPSNQSAPCDLPACPSDCVMGPWGDWLACSQSCSGGTATRFRNVKKSAAGGATCEHKTEQSAACCNEECPVDCELGMWSEWTECTATCGGSGISNRTRPVTVEPVGGGLACDLVTEKRECGGDPCPVDCVWSEWSAWKDCPVTCGSGAQERLRVEKNAAAAGGQNCTGMKEEVRQCEKDACPVCQASDWSDWGCCTASCGDDATTQRTRTVSGGSDSRGAPCPGGNKTVEEMNCNHPACPVDCQWDEWQDWRTCTATCGNGTALRMRLIKTLPLNGGADCDNQSAITKDCEITTCPEHCQWHDWEEWSACTKTCDSSQQRRARKQSPAKYGGAACLGKSIEDAACPNDPCPQDCTWNDWTEWSCSSSCGNGMSKRTRNIAEEAQHGGNCSDLDSELKPCANLPECPADCNWGDWDEWSTCSATCGPGLKRRLRNRTSYAMFGGHVCYGSQDDEAACTTGDCPVDCVPGDWSVWSECPVSCGSGQQHRSRVVKTQAAGGGADCVCDLSEDRSCPVSACPQDCVWVDWSDWSPCPESCGGSVRTRTRQEKQLAANAGKVCEGGVKEDEVCNVHQCPVDCSYGSWSTWAACSTSCGGGSRFRSRPKASMARYGGNDCEGNDTVSEICNDAACPVDCAWSEWSEWSCCSKSCNSGLTNRNRTRSTIERSGGAVCSGIDKEEDSCNTQRCSQDCKWGPWTEWTPCSKICGGGSAKRFRDVLAVKKEGGADCAGDGQEDGACNTKPCPVDCVLSEWTSWSSCDKSCDGGFRSRTRLKKVADKFGGVPCPGGLTEQLPCELPNCPVDCSFSAWSDWGECTASCGAGTRYKTRKRAEGRFGGAACMGGLIGSDDCVENEPGCLLATTPCPTTTDSISNLTDVLDAWLAEKPTSWDPDQKANGHPDPEAQAVVTSLNVEAEKIQEGLSAKDALQAGIAAGHRAAGGANATPSLEKLVKDISRYEGAKIKEQQSWLHQGKAVSATVTGNLVIYAEKPEAISQSGTARLSLERSVARLANVDVGAVDLVVKVPDEKELAEVNQKTQGNMVVAYTIYVYEGEKTSPETVSKALAAKSASAVTDVMQSEMAGPEFAAVAISMNLRVSRSKT